MKAKIAAWMKANKAPHTDPLTGELNHTALAEAAAYEFGHPEWLDDDQHIVWDCAVEA